MIVRVDDVLSAEECAALIKNFDEKVSEGTGKDFLGWPYIRYHDKLFGENIIIVDKAAHQARRALADRLDVHGQYMDQIILAGTGVGSYHVPHADNCKPDGKGGWEPNHTPQRTYTCMLYLNDQFEGGILKFPYKNVEFKPKPGMLIAFSSDGEHTHEVSRVESGFRYSLAMWTTDNKKHALYLS